MPRSRKKVKLPPGMTIVGPRGSFTGEAPADVVPAHVKTEPVEKPVEKPKAKKEK